METKASERMYEALHEAAPFHDGRFRNWSAEPSLLTPYHFRDGVAIWVAPTDLAPDEDFLTDPNAQPERR